jgi:hypothetical protein
MRIIASSECSVLPEGSSEGRKKALQARAQRDEAGWLMTQAAANRSRARKCERSGPPQAVREKAPLSRRMSLMSCWILSMSDRDTSLIVRGLGQSIS